MDSPKDFSLDNQSVDIKSTTKDDQNRKVGNDGKNKTDFKHGKNESKATCVSSVAKSPVSTNKSTIGTESHKKNRSITPNT